MSTNGRSEVTAYSESQRRCENECACDLGDHEVVVVVASIAQASKQPAACGVELWPRSPTSLPLVNWWVKPGPPSAQRAEGSTRVVKPRGLTAVLLRNLPPLSSGMRLICPADSQFSGKDDITRTNKNKEHQTKPKPKTKQKRTARSTGEQTKKRQTQTQTQRQRQRQRQKQTQTQTQTHRHTDTNTDTLVVVLL